MYYIGLGGDRPTSRDIKDGRNARVVATREWGCLGQPCRPTRLTSKTISKTERDLRPRSRRRL